eukprot:scpid90507/ scgid26255/ LAS seventeen-binding protein 3; LAS seventeen-binding protein 3
MLRRLRNIKDGRNGSGHESASHQRDQRDYYRRRSNTADSRGSGTRSGRDQSGGSLRRQSFSNALDEAWSAECKAIALWDFSSDDGRDLSFRRGDCIAVLTRTESQFDWWEGALRDKTGIFPANYVRLVTAQVKITDLLKNS